MNLAINQATLMKTTMDIFLDAISKAGFKGVELRRDETFVYLKHHSVQELKELLEKKGLKCISFNAIELFSLCPDEAFKSILDYTERLMSIGSQIGCNMIIAVPSFLEDPQMRKSKIISQTVDRLKILAKMTEKFDFKLGFEPLGFLNCSVRKLEMALKIIEHQDLPEMGLVIDTFHYFVGEHSIDELDPFNIACEGKALLSVDPIQADIVLKKIKSTRIGKDAEIMGEVKSDHPKKVLLKTIIGGTRFVDMPLGEPIPRICKSL
ncbi:MAG: hypothetical protein EU548_10180 [Promethearchaeota archaeon]|nr:MAG: hypothetical protein EU548_10180 [Candidatus Lokiarchaeota archaeon]